MASGVRRWEIPAHAGPVVRTLSTPITRGRVDG
jgi:hypothetical protein